MKKYHVRFSGFAKKQLRKLDKHIAFLLISWLEKNVDGASDPRQHGKALTANHAGKWRYRVGEYRILAEIQDETVTVLVVELGHRREVYSK